MFISIKGVIWNLSAYECLVASEGNLNAGSVPRISFYKNGEEVDYAQCKSYEDAQEIVKKICDRKIHIELVF